MNRQQIDFLKALDPQGLDGTIQNILLQKELHSVPFEKVCMVLLTQFTKEKQSLVIDNIRLTKMLNDLGE